VNLCRVEGGNQDFIDDRSENQKTPIRLYRRSSPRKNSSTRPCGPSRPASTLAFEGSFLNFRNEILEEAGLSPVSKRTSQRSLHSSVHVHEEDWKCRGSRHWPRLCGIRVSQSVGSPERGLSRKSGTGSRSSRFSLSLVSSNIVWLMKQLSSCATCPRSVAQPYSTSPYGGRRPVFFV
jgi:hypothetical protein